MDPVTIVEGRVSILDRADVDTDQIISKKQLKRIERTGYGEFLFHEWRTSGEISLEPNPILVTGANFGCGSSREHAVWALLQYGFHAIVAPSFAEIFHGNANHNGLLVVELPEDAVSELMGADRARIDLAAQTVTWDTGSARFEIDPGVKHRLLNGLDDIAVTLQEEGLVDAFEASGAADGGPATTSL